METFNPKKEWKDVKDYIKETYPNVTDKDLAYVKGQENKLLEILAEKTNRSKTDLLNWINTL